MQDHIIPSPLILTWFLKMILKKMIVQWKRGTHAIRKPEQNYGEDLVKILEQYDSSMLKLFDDYLEVGAFFLLVGLLREMDIQRMESAPPQSSSMVSPCRTGIIIDTSATLSVVTGAEDRRLAIRKEGDCGRSLHLPCIFLRR